MGGGASKSGKSSSPPVNESGRGNHVEAEEKQNVEHEEKGEEKVETKQADRPSEPTKESSRKKFLPHEEEIKRFRDKRKGFAGFRAALTNEEEGTSSSLLSALKIGPEGPKTAEDQEVASANLKDLSLIDKEFLSHIFEAMSECKVSKGQTVFAAGKVFPYFVLLVSGKLLLNGEEVTYANQQALLTLAPCTETLETVEDCRLWLISRVQYQKITVSALKDKLEKGGSLLENITEIPGLKELPRETREAIAAALKPITFSKGEFLMRQGEQGHTMYFIEEGTVVIKQNGGKQKITADMSEEEKARLQQGIVAYRTRGEYIGEGALLDDGEIGSNFGLRNASAIADSDIVRCLALGRNEFQEYLGSLRELFEHNLCFRVLKSLDLTKDLDDGQLSVLVSTLEEGEFNPGEFVVHQGEVGDIFYIVKEGTLDCTLESEEDDSDPKRIGTLIAGDYFGEGALLTNEPRRCNVISVGPGKTKVWGLKRSNFEQNLSEVLKQKLGDTFQHRRTAKESKTSTIEWDELHKIRTLGSGSYGTVDLVRHRVTGETYALKRIRKATVVAKKQQRFIKNERELLSVTSSPFIVNLIRTFNYGDSVYMLTEVCLGGELYSLMKDTVDARNDSADEDEPICGCFELESQCRFYTGCIILAIEYIHSKGIIHRDIKPENLLLNENGYLKLADFGFAKMIHDQRTYSLCGTPEYTAPEVYKRSGHSKGVDWWSLGVIVYEMASGFSPFHVVSQNSWDCYVEIAKYAKYYPNIQFPSLFGDELCDLLLRLMHPNPAKRYGTRKANATHVKSHPFFAKTKNFSFAMNWDTLSTQTFVLEEKFRPRPPESGLDANNFETCDDRHEQDEKYVDETMMQSAGAWDQEF